MKTAPAPLVAARTEGTRIVLDDGRELLDGIASWWTAVHGYNHPHIRAAVAAQLESMPHVMFGGLTHEPAETLARRLAALLPGDLGHVFFTESGSVSVEVALKMAAQGARNAGLQEKRKFLSFFGAYHGDTLATMALCDPGEGMHHRLRGLFPEPLWAELPTGPAQRSALLELLEANHQSIAAVVVEPRVQAAGGFRFVPDEALRELRRLCDHFGLVLIFDEIAVGFGRTGDLFACTGAGVVPDIVTVSKALTGGTLPLAATVATGAVFERFYSDDAGAALMHGPTYMANPLGCAAANASLDLFETEPRLEAARSIASQLEAGLSPARRKSSVRDVRVMGAIGVVELTEIRDLEGLRRRFVAEGVWIRPLGRCIYLMPALTITPDEVGQLCRAIVRVLDDR